jgi:hypothetical protein
MREQEVMQQVIGRREFLGKMAVTGAAAADVALFILITRGLRNVRFTK